MQNKNEQFLNKTVSELVREQPERYRVFESFNINYCCGGHMSLTESCEKRGIDPSVVISKLIENDSRSKEDSIDHMEQWNVIQLIEHLLEIHHAYLHEAMPRIEALIHKVAKAHGKAQPELIELARTYQHFYEEMQSHLYKEEGIVFPSFLRMEKEHTSGLSEASKTQISVLISEHQDTDNDLKMMRKLTNNYTPQAEGGCNSLRVLLNELKNLDKNVIQHLHIENNFLFPRVRELQS